MMAELRRTLEEHEFGSSSKRLTTFEVASLVNLTPLDAEEATTLIPSLHQKYTPDQITQLLEKMWRVAGKPLAAGGDEDGQMDEGEAVAPAAAASTQGEEYNKGGAEPGALADAGADEEIVMEEGTLDANGEGGGGDGDGNSI